MDNKTIQRFKDFLDYFRVDYSGDTIILTSGGNSIIANPDTQWKDFLGASINGVAEALATELGKETEWEVEEGRY